MERHGSGGTPRGSIAAAASIGLAVAVVALGIGLAVEARWATAAWPLPAGPLTHAFLGAILVALAAPVVWIAASGEWGAGASGGLFPAVAFAGLAAYLWGLRASGDPDVGLAAPVVATAVAAWGTGFVAWARRVPLRDGRRSPRPVRVAFALFALVLAAAGATLLARVDGVLPWPVGARTSTVIGIVFLGAALPYAAGAASSRWHEARGPLLGFVAYDLALLAPLVGRVDDVHGTASVSLAVYLAVLVASLALGVRFLLVDRRTRPWRPVPAPEPASSRGEPLPVRGPDRMA